MSDIESRLQTIQGLKRRRSEVQGELKANQAELDTLKKECVDKLGASSITELREIIATSETEITALTATVDAKLNEWETPIESEF